MDLPWADSSKDSLLTGHEVLDGNEVYVAFGKYVNVAYHTGTIDTLMSKFKIFKYFNILFTK